MNAISQALGSGYTAQHILKYLSQQNPQLAQKINSALNAGHTIEHVLNYMSRHQKNMGKLIPEKDQVNPSSNLYKTAKNQIHPSLTNIAKIAGTTALAAGGAYALSRSAPQLLQSLQGLPSQQLGQSIGSQIPTASSQLTSPTSGMQTQVPNNTQIPQQTQQPPVNPVAGNIPQVTQSEQPKVNFGEFLDKFKTKEKVDELIKLGNGPEIVGAYLKKFYPQLVKDMEKEAGDTVENVIGRYAEEKQNAPQEQKGIEPEGKKLDVSKETPEIKSETKTIEKNATVASPQGVGEVKEIRGDKALVEVDGKLHKVDLEDLEQESEDVIETVQNLLKIPEVDRSSVVSLFTYDPTDKEMYIQFHSGDTTKYFDVDPEKVYAVANKMGIPITQGKNIFGAWSPEDKQSLGATLIKEIINDPKYKKSKKGEAPNPNYRNLETLYDYWEKLRKKPKRKRL